MRAGLWWGTILASALTLAAPRGGHAQEGRLEGRLVGVVVSERSGLPIPGAVVALDAGIRVEADDEGVFDIPKVRVGPYRIAGVAPGCHVGLGEVTVVSGAAERIRLAVPLPPAAEDQLTRWTLGTRSLGESVKSIDADQMRRRHVHTVEDALRIIAPGLVGSETAQVGGRAVLRNRGAPTVEANAEPLVILDGVPIPQRSVEALATVEVSDLALVEVMRGGAGGWRYGVKGANGVIRLTTRDATGGFSAQTAPRDCPFAFPG